MNLLVSLLQEVNIEEKLKNAPDDNYGIGVFIGSMLPFIILVIIAYAVYRYNKKRMNND